MLTAMAARIERYALAWPLTMLVGLDVRLALFAFQPIVLVTQALVLGLQLAHRRLQILDQVEQQHNGLLGLLNILNLLQINLFERHADLDPQELIAGLRHARYVICQLTATDGKSSVSDSLLSCSSLIPTYWKDTAAGPAESNQRATRSGTRSGAGKGARVASLCRRSGAGRPGSGIRWPEVRINL